MLFYGAGEAGTGIAELVAIALHQRHGMSLEEVRPVPRVLRWSDVTPAPQPAHRNTLSMSCAVLRRYMGRRVRAVPQAHACLIQRIAQRQHMSGHVALYVEWWYYASVVPRLDCSFPASVLW